MSNKPSFLLLFLLISFGSVTAVLFTPALPEIQQFFSVSKSDIQKTMTLFLIGYAIGQLLYGPLANRFGRKIALYLGIALEIVGALLCVASAYCHSFTLLVIARLLMALGASVGLKMTFTLIADTHTQEKSKKIIAQLMMAFAITPAIGIAIGGWLTEHLSWSSTFYFTAVYGVVLFALVLRMPETARNCDKQALHPIYLIKKYRATLQPVTLPLSSLLMGCGTSFVYVFASLSPFIAMQSIGLNPAQYGTWNLAPVIGVITGAQLSVYFSQKWLSTKSIIFGISLIALGSIIMLISFVSHYVQAISLFLPLIVIYIGTGFVYSSASSMAIIGAKDASNTAAMMSFINVGTATLSVLIVGAVSIRADIFLPSFFVVLTLFAVLFAWLLNQRLKHHGLVIPPGTMHRLNVDVEAVGLIIRDMKEEPAR